MNQFSRQWDNGDTLCSVLGVVAPGSNQEASLYGMIVRDWLLIEAKWSCGT
jgi:hypothetical protein